MDLMPVMSVFDVVHIDILGPFPASCGKRYVLAARCAVSGWIEARMIWHKSMKEVANFIKEEIFARHGVPRKIITDQGTEFIN